MTEQLVPTVRTSVTMRMYARAVALAWRDAFGELPTKGQAGVLYAQYGVETGGPPNASCWNFNLGNVKHVPGDAHNYVMLHGVTEVVNGKTLTFEPPNPATWFRAFDTLDAAMREHFSFLRGRYARCWEGVEREDVDMFAHKLKEGPDGKEGTRDDYYTADANAYAAGMRAHFARWMASGDFEAAVKEIGAGGPNIITPDQLMAEAEVVHPPVPLPERD